MSAPGPDLPSTEAIEYGRRVIGEVVQRYRHFAASAAASGEVDMAERHRMRAAVVERELLGDGGCVIAPFDERWLDPEFRLARTLTNERDVP